MVIILFSQVTAFAGTEYVDGISDQGIAYWTSTGWNGQFGEGTFPEFFAGTWIGGQGHIKYARYVVQWNALTLGLEGNNNHREQFEKWYHDVTSPAYNLTLDLSLTIYNKGEAPPSFEKYDTQLKKLLAWGEKEGHPFSYVEAWNEPNNQGNDEHKLKAQEAAEYTWDAYEACKIQPVHCTVIGGNLEDGAGAEKYENEYIGWLKQLKTIPSVWGIHAYGSVQEENLKPYEEVANPAGHSVSTVPQGRRRYG